MGNEKGPVFTTFRRLGQGLRGLDLPWIRGLSQTLEKCKGVKIFRSPVSTKSGALT